MVTKQLESWGASSWICIVVSIQITGSLGCLDELASLGFWLHKIMWPYNNTKLNWLLNSSPFFHGTINPWIRQATWTLQATTRYHCQDTTNFKTPTGGPSLKLQMTSNRGGTRWNPLKTECFMKLGAVDHTIENQRMIIEHLSACHDAGDSHPVGHVFRWKLEMC